MIQNNHILKFLASRHEGLLNLPAMGWTLKGDLESYDTLVATYGDAKTVNYIGRRQLFRQKKK